MSYPTLLRDVRNIQITEESDGGMRLTIEHGGNVYEKHFNFKSAEARRLAMSSVESMERLLIGGAFLVSDDGGIIDYRDGAYTGFIHNESAIKELSDRVGFQVGSDRRKGPTGQMDRFARMAWGRKASLGGWGDTFGVDLKGLGAGGKFENTIYLRWSPFSPLVSASLYTLRLICTNGMMGTAEAATFEAPVISNYSAELAVFQRQIAPQMRDRIDQRMGHMSHHRASLETLIKLEAALRDSAEGLEARDRVDAIEALRSHVSAHDNLDHFYRLADIPGTKRKLLAGHLSQLDCYNVATEAMSHFAEGETRSLQSVANFLLYDDAGVGAQAVTEKALPKRSEESDPARAFFAGRG